ncbi:MAG: Excinuclease ABC C subunit domain protein [Candidatus Magasanikbacteria bacterium GW2011_GWC2_37_14]|uniref:Excinuclease ABC C subunit domain protein n=1 Tax=Candidatus Magasanikbacteria bacterium GW2011_GWC2_37_14 TaxID=1619046 RepID=A0A0G0G881_9BACT|nr:MAG: Excinuclease ABC C subunit domain protein [Candidatus Magasanikbacteria bacterium GW2011_GWC2_37_14]
MLENKLKNLSDRSGIYLFYNIKKKLIYVGKATSLRNRVRSYFRGVIPAKAGILQPNKISAYAGMTLVRRPIEQMIHEVVDIKTIQTDSVLEAIILEANTIKKIQPKYNVDLKDDKSWNYIVITDDKFPKVLTVREHELKLPTTPQPPFNKGGKKVRSLTPLGKGGRGGLLFGPYPGLKTKEMINLLRKLFYISTCIPRVETQNFASLPKKPCFYYQLGQCLGVCTGEISSAEYKKKVIKPLVQFLNGKKKSLLKNLEYDMKRASKNHEFEEAGRLRDQIKNLQKIQDIALLNKSFVESPVIARSLSDEAIPPKQGIATPRSSEARNDMRIEGYDISNLGSSGKVGSMVVFENSEPNKKEYRKFKIKTVVGQSDVDCLAEVIERRLKHNEWGIPQVILVDGGVPQVNRVCKILSHHPDPTATLGHPSSGRRGQTIPVVGIAKGPERKKNDFIYVRNPKISKLRNREIVKWINSNKDLLIRVRDEAHRFAIKYQRSLRKIII